MNVTTTQAVSEDRILRQLKRAVQHPRPLNPHARKLVRWGRDPQVAATVSHLLGNHNASQLHMLELEGIIVHYGYLGALLRCDLAGLIGDGDHQALYVALDTALRTLAGTPDDVIDEEVALRAADPAALVRTAYALARDLAVFEGDFDAEND